MREAVVVVTNSSSINISNNNNQTVGTVSSTSAPPPLHTVNNNEEEVNQNTQSEQSWILLTPTNDNNINNTNTNWNHHCTQSIIVNNNEKKEDATNNHQIISNTCCHNNKEKQNSVMDNELKLKSSSTLTTSALELAEKGELIPHVAMKFTNPKALWNDGQLHTCYKCCLLSTPLLCLCWSAIVVFSLFIVACFGHYSHLPIDSTGSCSTLYNNELVLGPIVTMSSIDLNKERTFFSSAADFNNKSSDNLPINYYNTLMTHNSYHRKGILSPFIPSMNYEHDSLTNQLNRNVRGLELDIHLNRRTQRFQVYHVPLIDDRSNCNCFLSCLLEIKNWISAASAAANAHEHNSKPDLITIFIEPKYARDYISFCRREDRTTLPNLMNEILRVFPAEQILTPAKLKGDYPSLRSSVNSRGWPLKNSVKGMVLFVLNLWDENDDCKYLFKNEKPFYSNNVTSMDLIFYREHWNNMASSKSDSVFFEVDDARVFMNTSSIEPMLLSTALIDHNTLYVEDPSYIIQSPVSRSVQHGYMIRCTAGAVTELKARISIGKKKSNSNQLKYLSKTEACLRSGAQLLNTDYPYAELFTSLFTNQTFGNPMFIKNSG